MIMCNDVNAATSSITAANEKTHVIRHIWNQHPINFRILQMNANQPYILRSFFHFDEIFALWVELNGFSEFIGFIQYQKDKNSENINDCKLIWVFLPNATKCWNPHMWILWLMGFVSKHEYGWPSLNTPSLKSMYPEIIVRISISSQSFHS